MWRQGDIFIETVKAVPEQAKARPSLILAEGEITGHSHRVRDSGTAVVLAHESGTFLEVTAAEAVVVHDEHAPIPLVRGTYRFWRQREYSPEAIRVVRD